MIFSHFPGAAPLHPATKRRAVASGNCQVLKEVLFGFDFQLSIADEFA
jgi:hypothetical protein